MPMSRGCLRFQENSFPHSFQDCIFWERSKAPTLVEQRTPGAVLLEACRGGGGWSAGRFGADPLHGSLSSRSFQEHIPENRAQLAAKQSIMFPEAEALGISLGTGFAYGFSLSHSLCLSPWPHPETSPPPGSIVSAATFATSEAKHSR